MALNLRPLRKVVADAMQQFNVPGVSIGLLHDGDEHYVSDGITSVDSPLPVDAETMFQIGSTTKTYTGTAMMMFVEEGKVDLDAPVTKYLPTFKLSTKEATAALRVHHLVTHTGGFLGDYFDDLGRGDDALKRIVGRIRTRAPQLTPVGAIWSYNNAGFYILGRILEVVSGDRYEDLIASRILGPLGMTSTFWFPEDVITHKTALGHVPKADGSLTIARPWGLVRASNPAGGIVSTAPDQMRYARFHLAAGKNADGQRLLRAGSARLMQRPRVKIGWGLADKVGVTWLIDDYGGTRVLKHGGSINGHMSEFLMVPSRDFAVTVLTNGHRGHELGGAVLQWCLESLLGLRRPEPTPKSIGAAKAAEYTGRYGSGIGEYVATAEDGGLLLTLEPKKELLEDNPDLAGMLPPPVPLRFVGKDRAVVVGDYTKGARVEFFRDDDGPVEWMRSGGRLARRNPE